MIAKSFLASTLSIFLTVMGLFTALPSSGQGLSCWSVHGDGKFVIQARHFETSAFGLVHAERPGQSRYAAWSAETTNQVLAALRRGADPAELFVIGVKARQEFARVHEGFQNPENDFGAPRETRANKNIGEDMMGVSSITLEKVSATALPEDFKSWPDPWWSNIVRNEGRIKLADEIIMNLLTTQKVKVTDYDEFVAVRDYKTISGQILRSSSTKLQRAIRGQRDSPYFVSTLNVPKSEIQIFMKDVYHRIKMALKTQDKQAGRIQLANAMYAFFNAMPYYRGSAAIGRIVFTALFSLVEGRPMVIHPECDIKALVQMQEEFVGNINWIVRPAP